VSRAGYGVCLPQIRTTRIGTCAEYVDYLPDIPDGCFPEDLLQRMFTLLIERGVLSEDALHRLLSSSMTGLNLRGWKQLSPASCSVIARCTLLRRLDLAGTPSLFLFRRRLVVVVVFPSSRLPRHGTNEGPSGRPVKPPPSVSVVALLPGCTGLLDEGLAEILRSASTALESLSVEGCTGLTDSWLSNLSLCPNLRSLDASSCPRITDATLKDLPLRCPRLTALHLRRCPLVRPLSATPRRVSCVVCHRMRLLVVTIANPPGGVWCVVCGV
jgi:hypothetical protein